LIAVTRDGSAAFLRNQVGPPLHLPVTSTLGIATRRRDSKTQAGTVPATATDLTAMTRFTGGFVTTGFADITGAYAAAADGRTRLKREKLSIDVTIAVW